MPNYVRQELTNLLKALQALPGSQVDIGFAQPIEVITAGLALAQSPGWSLDYLSEALTFQKAAAEHLITIKRSIEPCVLPEDYEAFQEVCGGFAIDLENGWNLSADGIGLFASEYHGSIFSEAFQGHLPSAHIPVMPIANLGREYTEERGRSGHHQWMMSINPDVTRTFGAIYYFEDTDHDLFEMLRLSAGIPPQSLPFAPSFSVWLQQVIATRGSLGLDLSG